MSVYLKERKPIRTIFARGTPSAYMWGDKSIAKVFRSDLDIFDISKIKSDVCNACMKASHIFPLLPQKTKCDCIVNKKTNAVDACVYTYNVFEEFEHYLHTAPIEEFSVVGLNAIVDIELFRSIPEPKPMYCFKGIGCQYIPSCDMVETPYMSFDVLYTVASVLKVHLMTSAQIALCDHMKIKTYFGCTTLQEFNAISDTNECNNVLYGLGAPFYMAPKYLQDSIKVAYVGLYLHFFTDQLPAKTVGCLFACCGYKDIYFDGEYTKCLEFNGKCIHSEFIYLCPYVFFPLQKYDDTAYATFVGNCLPLELQKIIYLVADYSVQQCYFRMNDIENSSCTMVAEAFKYIKKTITDKITAESKSIVILCGAFSVKNLSINLPVNKYGQLFRTMTASMCRLDTNDNVGWFVHCAQQGVQLKKISHAILTVMYQFYLQTGMMRFYVN